MQKSKIFFFNFTITIFIKLLSPSLCMVSEILAYMYIITVETGSAVVELLFIVTFIVCVCFEFSPWLVIQ